MWYEPALKWVITAALPDQHKVRFFESHDLIRWEALTDFGPAGATGGVWECPDLFELPLAGHTGKRWVLIVNINPGGVAGGSGTQYFVGDFDGNRFTNANKPFQELWMDYGKDYYAAVSYFGHKPGDERRIMIGWFSNWQYANDTPETDWRGAMALPREITLVQTEQGVRVRQRPIQELDELRQAVSAPTIVPARQGSAMTIAQANQQLQAAAGDGKTLEIEIVFAPGEARQYGIKVFGRGIYGTEIGVDHNKHEIYIDRTRSGKTSFSKYFPARQTAPLGPSATVKLNIFLDRSSIEVFANDGAVTMADRVYPAPNDNGLSFFVEGKEPRVESLRLWRMQSIWEHPAKLEHGAAVVPLGR